MNIQDAINHFKYGITHDIFSEPVTSYAKMAVEALEKMRDREQSKDEDNVKYTEAPIRQCNGAMFCPICGSRIKI